MLCRTVKKNLNTIVRNHPYTVSFHRLGPDFIYNVLFPGRLALNVIAMEATLRRTVNSVTDVIFPPSKSTQDPQQHQILKAGNEYVTSLPLQMALYFNAFFSPFWLVATVVVFEVKYSALSTLYAIILLAIYIVFTIIEIVRLYLGFLGNLTERVPELAGSWLLTILIQFPLIILLLFNEDAVLLPLERAVHIVMALFVFFEVVYGYFAIRFMVNYQVTKFHLKQFSDLENLSDNDYWQDKYESYT